MSQHLKIAIALLTNYLFDNLGDLHAVTLRLLIKNVRDLTEDVVLRKRLRGVMTYLNRKPQYATAINILKAVTEDDEETLTNHMWFALEGPIQSLGYRTALEKWQTLPDRRT